MRMSDWSADGVAADVGDAAFGRARRRKAVWVYLRGQAAPGCIELFAIDGKLRRQAKQLKIVFACHALHRDGLAAAASSFFVGVGKFTPLVKPFRSEEPRVGKECGSTLKFRWSP